LAFTILTISESDLAGLISKNRWTWSLYPFTARENWLLLVKIPEIYLNHSGRILEGKKLSRPLAAKTTWVLS
jgi:hypothetical protein